MVNVTTEALQQVKKALSDFQTDVEGMGAITSQHADGILDECQQQINKAKSDVEQSELRVSDLSKQLVAVQQEIQDVTCQINIISTKIASAEKTLPALDRQISSLESQIARAQSRLSYCQDEDQRRQVQFQVSTLQQQLGQARSQRQQVQATLSNLRTEKSRQEQTLREDKACEARTQSELGQEKARCNRLRDKLTRLRNAFVKIQDNLRSYVSTAKRFENASTESAQRKISSVQTCIRSVEAYLATSLDVPSASGGNPATGSSPSNVSFSGGHATSDVNWDSTMNTPGELEQIREMEANGEFSGDGSDTLIQEYAYMPHRGASSRGLSSSDEVMACAPGEYHYERSEHGAHAFGQLHLTAPSERHRNSYAQRQAGGEVRRNDDDGGHFIAALFGGSSELENLFPQNRQLNRSSYRRLERHWERLMSPPSNCRVFVSVNASACTAGVREDALYGTYTVISPTGESYTDAFSFANENNDTQAGWEVFEP